MPRLTAIWPQTNSRSSFVNDRPFGNLPVPGVMISFPVPRKAFLGGRSLAAKSLAIPVNQQKNTTISLKAAPALLSQSPRKPS